MKLMNGKWISVRLFKVCISLAEEGKHDAVKNIYCAWLWPWMIEEEEEVF